MSARPTFRVFLSAVSSEFATARAGLASDLRSRGLEVRVQEDFRQEADADTTLRKLHDYIHDCAAVVCLTGRRSGTVPPEAPVRPFIHMLPAGIDRASYTQWEFFFARHYRRRLSLYLANAEYPPDEATPTGPDFPELQQRFVAHLKEEGLDRSDFGTVDHLCQLVLREDWPSRSRSGIIVPCSANVGTLIEGRAGFLPRSHTSQAWATEAERAAHAVLMQLRIELQGQPYQWYMPVAQCVAFQRRVIPLLVKVLRFAARDAAFLPVEEWLLYACILAELSWTQTDAIRLNKLAKRSFRLAEHRIGDAHVPSMALHLMAHNDLGKHGAALMTLWLRQDPLSHRGLADWLVERGYQAMAPLLIAPVPLAGWRENIAEMIEYQLATNYISRLWHPQLRKDRTTDRCLEELRERAGWWNLLRAELAHGVTCRDKTWQIDVLEQYLARLDTSSDPAARETAAILDLDLKALHSPQATDVVDGLFAASGNHLVPLIRRDKCFLLPCAQEAILAARSRLGIAASVGIIDALDTPGGGEAGNGGSESAVDHG